MPFWSFWDWQNLNLVLFTADVPGMPTSLTVTDVDRNAISVMWNRPRNDGGCRIRRYVIERCDVERNFWTTAGTVDASQTNFTGTCQAGDLPFDLLTHFLQKNSRKFLPPHCWANKG